MPNENSSTSLIDTLFLLQQNVIITIYPLFFIFGITGCLFNLGIFVRPKLRKTSCCIYFFAASADHLFTLLIGIGTMLYSLNHSNPQTESLAFCKIRGYTFQITLMFSRWFVAFACIDRYASSARQIRFRNFANSQKAVRTILIIIMFWSIICTHRLIFYEIQDNICGIFSNKAAAIYHSVYVIIGGGILPTIIMTTCACLIRRNLRLKRKAHINRVILQFRKNSLDRQVYNLLFIQIIFYVIFTMPQLCYLVFAAFTASNFDKSMDQLAIEKFISFIAESFLYLFPVTSFYLYTITSPTFRKELTDHFRFIPLVRNYLTRSIRPTVSTINVNYHAESGTATLHHNQKAINNKN